MVARTPTSLKSDDIEVGYWEVLEAEVSTNDTVTLSNFKSSADPDQHLVLKKSDRSTVTHTVANNVITITQGALTNIDVIIFAAGVKAA
jgi:hypothetical protein